ncbi:uncharacterized protein YbjT (DUF2867 family) [Lysinibacillus composti]|nr:NAD-dependent epimerase/dehydratase family protein [Lysinibacillus composti]MBM7609640.1 uncharacterized protein YbjT (DUF2867 family) [Lysinibacillus composti]
MCKNKHYYVYEIDLVFELYAVSWEKMKGCAKLVEMRSAIVVGATGLVGSALVKLLCESEEYIAVTAITRRKLDYEHPKLIVKICSFDQLEEAHIEFADELFCCLGTTIKKAGTREEFEKVDVEYPLRIASLAKKRGIAHAIVISAMSANETSLFYYNRVKGKLEKELIELQLPKLSIVRPSLLVGERSEFRFGEKMGEALLSVLNPLLIGPLKKYRSIQSNQVALAMLAIALYGKKSPVTIYASHELARIHMPEPQEEQPVTREQLFNWDKFKEEDIPPIDEEIVFDQSKLQNIKRLQDRKEE